MRLLRRFLVLGLLTVSAAVSQTNQFQGSVPTGAASSTPLALTLSRCDRSRPEGESGSAGQRFGERKRARPAAPRTQRAAAAARRPGRRDGRAAQPENHRIQFHIPGRLHPHHSSARFTTPTCAPTLPGTRSTTARARTIARLSRTRRAAQLSVMDARDLVVQATANAYLQIIADASRMEAIRSQVETAQALYDRTADQQTRGNRRRHRRSALPGGAEAAAAAAAGADEISSTRTSSRSAA